MKSPCRALARELETYLDGELSPTQQVEIEKHLPECATCHERVNLDRAIRTSLRGAGRAQTAPVSLRSRVTQSVMAESTRAREASAESPKAELIPARYAVWMGLAAAFALVPLGLRQRNAGNEDIAPAPVQEAKATAGFDSMINQFVDWHARPLPPEVTSANDLTAFEPYVGVPVHALPLSPFGAKLVGGRILPVQAQRAAAMLQYTMQGGHRISVYVYDPERLSVSPSVLRPHRVGSESVYVGHVRGYSVATAQRRGVGYAVASDLEDDESAELALAAAP